MPLGRWSRTNLTVLATLPWLSLGLIAPLIWSYSSHDTLVDAVEASTSEAFTITQPIVLSTVPLIRIDRGSALFVDSSGAPLPPGSRMPSTNGNIRLFNASISVGTTAEPETTSTPDLADALSPLSAVLAGIRFDTLQIRQSTIFFAMHGETREAITDVKAEVSLRRRGQVSAKGEGKVRGQPVSLDLLASPGQAEKRSNGQIRSPFRFALKSQNVEAAFDGRMVVSAGALAFEGPGDLSLAGARRVARWFGAYWPSASGMRDISVRGQLKLNHEALTFDKAIVRMDGNEGAGVLGIRFATSRPLISGTLAYKSLDIAPYLSAVSDGGSLAPLSWSSVAGGKLTVPLGRHLDADVRISADRVLVHKFDLGPTATTLALKDGRLLADITGIAFNGSEGGGQITADFNGPLPRVTMRGKFDSVDFAPWSTTFGSPQVLQGKAIVVADVTGSGARLQDVLENLSGKIAVRSQGAGRLAIDIPALLAAAKADATVGWKSLAGSRGTTTYDAADLRLILRDGTLLTDTVEVRTPDGIWVATGIANVLANRIDMRLSHSPPAAPNTPASLAPAAVLEIKGSLTEPRFKLEQGQ